MNQQIALKSRWPVATQFLSAFKTARAIQPGAAAAAEETETPLVDHEALRRVLAAWREERESEARPR